ncbi:MAG: GntR family transcriptional regulator [Gammaproteobacteria bacterium]|nr:GntR family transcriptional regulator [Gammaproteobacteria bacterium]MCY4164871.1 GntR family transcriptional regulator [Gammaproteobacteria bacterium]MCY4256104.1 GntR family transcriptional regulator [Gammaproteobacteria bacterium]MCY4340790.1 GntR family transcriptional regulator [Gammaproteobacteria bacterium]
MIDLSSSRSSSTPLYIQIAKSIRQHIKDGQIAKGDAIPSERELCHLTGASRVTIRKAVDQLIDEGLLLRKQGSGTFVSERIEMPATYLGGFTEDMRARGEAPGSVWLARSYANPTRAEAAELKVPMSSAVVRLGRVRLSQGEPLAIEQAVVAKPLLPPLEEIGDSLYAALETRGNRPQQGRQKVRASIVSPTEAGLLSIPEKSAVLRIERVTWLEDGSVIEFTRSVYRGDRYQFVTNIR